MSGYDNALRRYVQSQLPDGAVIESVNVDWDDGDRYDPTYGGGNTTPSFNISVTYDVPGAEPVPKYMRTHSLDFEMTFSALLAAVLGVGQ